MLRVGLWGCGGVSGTHRRAYDNLEKAGVPVKLVALCDINKENFNKFAGKFIGQEIDVLFEQSIAENTYEGLTPNYIRVIVKSDREIHGEILKVKLTDIKDEYVEGTLV